MEEYADPCNAAGQASLRTRAQNHACRRNGLRLHRAGSFRAGAMNVEIHHDLPLGTGVRPDSRLGRRVRRSDRGWEPASAAMLYLRSRQSAESVLQFCSFDASYIESLRAGDPSTQEHFVQYFTELLHLKLRSRLQSPQAIEDVRQETFARVLKTLRKEDGLRQPERLGAFVNTVCNNVLLEHYRAYSRSDSLDEEGRPEPQAVGADALDMAAAKQLKGKVREILLGMPMRERLLLKAVFLDERDREEVCLEFGVDRDYLRVLLHRAKQEFKVEYVKRIGSPMPADFQRK
jgi:RNA polymerase sigma-70 factor (ECF subfamily)